MRLGYTLLYVTDVAATLAFYETAFGMARRFLHDSGLYAEMDTGQTTLAFAATDMAQANGLTICLPDAGQAAPPFALCLLSDAPAQDYARAVAAGATAIAPVTTKPWGQQVGYVRDLNGVLVEICSPMGG